MSSVYRPARTATFGLLAALLALVSQLALGAMVIPNEADQTTALAAASILCNGQPDPGPARPRHHGIDQAICPLSIALALPAVTLSPAPTLPAPASARIAPAYDRPPGRGPPSPAARVGAPRGPPGLA